MKKTSMVLLSGVAATALLLSGCTASGSTPSPAPTSISQAEIDKAMDTETTLTYWSWASFIKPAVAQFQLKGVVKVRVTG